MAAKAKKTAKKARKTTKKSDNCPRENRREKNC